MRKYWWIFVVTAVCGISCGKYTPSEPSGGASLNGFSQYSGTTIPVSGVLVSFQGKSATTSSDGSYRLEGLPEGAATLLATKPGYDDYSASISVADGANVRNIPMTSALYTHNLRGIVQSLATGGALQGVTVTVLNDDSTSSSLSTTTDISGLYQVPTVPQGQRKVKYSKQNYQTHVAQIFMSDSDYTYNVVLAEKCPPSVDYEGGPYPTVKIENQCWLAKNLNVGARINGVQNPSNSGTVEKYCYNNDTANCTTYGGLYQWNEAMQYSATPGSRGICPPGWHIPTYAEIQTLKSAVGGNGNALKAVGQGTGGGAGTNTSGFSALLAGYRDNDSGGFANLGNYAYFWSSTEHDASYALSLYLSNLDSDILVLSYTGKPYGFSVRCLED